ncbi:alpha/beta hydrolase [Streptomyces purpureus]|uniref:Acetylhydrolase n=1 Tax=Streptomyces purpureus TaxID=1951 RepID=A0A918HI15_9ACTN|nr:alpha/beta hydrolase [Streptomyces purpureus]GGT64878.1 acetylhydrolase [Streptomyces purpureus]
MPNAAVSSSDAVEWQPVRVPAATHEVPGRVFLPRGGHRGWLVWAHGGSWRSGSVAGWHQACADLALRSGCAVVSVEYRLAPEHPHPAALEDVLAVLDWAQERSAAEGLGPVSVGGDSSGGTIAASAAVVWRDAGRELRAQVLAYPPMDPSCRGASFTRFHNNFPTREGLAQAWRDYRGTRAVPGMPSTPFEVADLSGLAPAIVGVGEFDAVADDVREFARRLSQAGNDVAFREFPRMLHGAFLQMSEHRPGDDPYPLRAFLGGTLRGRLAGAVAPSAKSQGPGARSV